MQAQNQAPTQDRSAATSNAWFSPDETTCIDPRLLLQRAPDNDFTTSQFLTDIDDFTGSQTPRDIDVLFIAAADRETFGEAPEM